MREYLKFYIGGQWADPAELQTADPAELQTMDVVNPATEQFCGKVRGWQRAWL